MKYVEIQLTKYRLCLTESELINLLAKDPELWAAAIRRGKFFRREEAAQRREKSVENSFNRNPRRR